MARGGEVIRFAAVVIALLPIPITAGVLDDFTTVEEWEAHPSDGVRLDISTGDGRTGRAMRLDFDFGGGGGYAIARLPVRLDLPENYEFSFWIRGQTPVQTLEFKLLDPPMENVWWSVRRRYRFPEEWRRIRIRKRHLNFAWGPRGGGEIRTTAGLELVIVAAVGGKGTVWIDDLTFTPLAADRPFEEERNRFGAWSGRNRHEIDFGRRRELGGLRIQWDANDYATGYDVLTSADGREWETVWRVRDGDGGEDWVFIPEGEARHVRLDLKEGAGRRFAIREIEVQPASFSDSKNAMFDGMARAARRGLYPKYLLGQQSYWTIVGAPADMREALISEDGTIDIDPIRFSIEPFLSTSSSLLTWADATLTQSLAEEELPIPSVVRDHGDLRLTVTTFARGEEGHSVLLTRYRVENRTNAAANATLHLAIRPLQVNPSWQFLATPGGAADITSIERKDGAIVVNDTTTIIPITPLQSFRAMRFDQGDIMSLMEARVSSPAPRVEDPFGSASGVMSWPLQLAAGSWQDVVIAIPFHQRPADLDTSLNFDRELAVATGEWAGRLGRVAIHLPPEAARIGRAIRSNLAYILINADGAAIQPGSRSYDRSWIRDGSLTSAALLRLGHAEEVRRFVEWYGQFQRPNGYVPCCVSPRGGDPVPEHDSHGQFIYLIREYYEFTRDLRFLERMWPHVEKAVAYIDSLRRERMTDEYRTPEKLAFFGLVPESISHEGYSAKPMHSYWDDFFVLTGLKDATEIARILGRSEEQARFAAIRDGFRRDLYASIERAMASHNIDYIPGSVELGDFDATSTTTAVNPGGELGNMPAAALRATFERYWQEFVARRDGAKEWEGYTPYEWRTVGTFVRLGQPERAHQILDWFFTHVRPPAWNHWAEVVFRDPATPKFIGDMPHTWVGSDFIRSVLDMFAYERGDALVLGAGIPERWVGTQPIGVEMLRTPHGPLTYSMRREGDGVVVRIEEGIAMPPGGIVVVSPVDRKETVVRELPYERRLHDGAAGVPTRRRAGEDTRASISARTDPYGLILAGERVVFDEGVPRFTEEQVLGTDEATRRGLVLWAATDQGRALMARFDRPDYRIFVIEDGDEYGMGRAPQPAIATMVAGRDQSRLKAYQVILNPSFARLPESGRRIFQEPGNAAELMAAAWAGEMLHVYFYSLGIVLPHHERDDFQLQWQEMAAQLGFPALRHEQTR
ncbi:MAG TPA: discoidin domain-containing protein [Thermoanaerobaculia bacterium]|nr:discoidin domain-containing protein [Thermoanaerobaculia bacterium]